MNAVVQWYGAVLSSLRISRSGCRVSDASVGDGAAHGDSQQTTPSSSSGVVVVVATWTIYSFEVRVGNGG